MWYPRPVVQLLYQNMPECMTFYMFDPDEKALQKYDVSCLLCRIHCRIYWNVESGAFCSYNEHEGMLWGLYHILALMFIAWIQLNNGILHI
jgi:hypothetical protein